MSEQTHYVVLGGGIAGVSCCKTLRTLAPDQCVTVTLLSPSSIVKSVTNLTHLTPNLTEFNVEATLAEDFASAFPGIDIRHQTATKIDPEKHVVTTSDNQEIKYTKLCVCTGARPCLISESPHVIGIRDTETVKQLESRLKSARKVLVVGNGGIAMELVYGLKDIEVVWAIKDQSIGTAFLDSGAAQFLIPDVGLKQSDQDQQMPCPRSKYTVFNLVNNTSSKAKTSEGSALGPDWQEQAVLSGKGTSRVEVEYGCEVLEIVTDKEKSDDEAQPWPVYVKLSNGKVIGCDFVVSATGVTPCSDIIRNTKLGKIAGDSGAKVDQNMRVIGLSDVYAAGDVSSCSWEKSPQWLQMRLWTQARQMGIFSAQCMVHHQQCQNEDMPLDFCFELFAHATRFFGYKVVLLGLFNAQGLEPADTEFVVRVVPGKEYIKVVLVNGRMYGAVLVGETDLEETFENLILNQTDLSHYGDNLLHPSVMLEDYFD